MDEIPQLAAKSKSQSTPDLKVPLESASTSKTSGSQKSSEKENETEWTDILDHEGHRVKLNKEPFDLKDYYAKLDL